jgi:hypothetical protein
VGSAMCSLAISTLTRLRPCACKIPAIGWLNRATAVRAGGRMVMAAANDIMDECTPQLT